MIDPRVGVRVRVRIRIRIKGRGRGLGLGLGVLSYLMKHITLKIAEKRSLKKDRGREFGARIRVRERHMLG